MTQGTMKMVLSVELSFSPTTLTYMYIDRDDQRYVNLTKAMYPHGINTNTVVSNRHNIVSQTATLNLHKQPFTDNYALQSYLH